MNRSVILLAASVLAGCYQSPLPHGPADVDGLGVEEDVSGRATEGSPLALGMIAFLNDEATTYELLDLKVGLDRRAAESLIAHRNGPDGKLGWLHDDLYDSVQEIDDQYYVGKTAFAALEAWVMDHGWVATEPGDILGTWDGVTFTVEEAEATVAFANTASYDLLDHDLGLDARAATSIVSAGEITSVEQLAGLYYVGKTALTVLKDAANAEVACDAPGWEQVYVYNDGTDAWRDQVPAGLAEVVDEVLLRDDWCGEAVGQPYFVKVAIDRHDCVPSSYYIELGQEFLGGGAPWYIEFEVDGAFSWNISACEV